SFPPSLLPLLPLSLLLLRRTLSLVRAAASKLVDSFGSSKSRMTSTSSLWQLTPTIFVSPFPLEMEDWPAFYRYIQNTFAGRYKLYNLSGARYDYHVFDGVVVEYPLLANDVPSFALLKEIVDDIVRRFIILILILILII